MKTNIFLSILFALLVTSCSTIHTETDYDRNVDFTQYKTFSIHQKGLNDLKLNDLDKDRITSALTTTLQNKGLQKSDNGDIIINIKASSKNQVNVNHSMNYGFGLGWGWSMWGNYSRPYINQQKVGTLVFDFIDSKKNTLVWQGVGSGLPISRIEKKEELLPNAVTKILEKFPPKK